MTNPIYQKMLSHRMLENKYTKWYFSIVESYHGKIIPEDAYCENHHIMPKCIEKDNSKENIVRIRVKYHVILHHLLTKMFKGKIYYQMMAAYVVVVRMNNEKQLPIRIERAKKYNHKLMLENHPMKDRNHTEESRKKQSKSRKKLFENGYVNPSQGRPPSEETRKKISEGHKHLYENGYVNPMKGVKRTEEWKENHSKTMKGRYMGEKSSQALFTNEEVLEIRADPRLWIHGGVSEIARELGKEISAISRIKHRVTYRDI